MRQAGTSQDSPSADENVGTMEEVMAILNAREDEADADHKQEMEDFDDEADDQVKDEEDNEDSLMAIAAEDAPAAAAAAAPVGATAAVATGAVAAATGAPATPAKFKNHDSSDDDQVNPTKTPSSEQKVKIMAK